MPPIQHLTTSEKPTQKKMPPRFERYYAIITVWDIAKGQEAAGFLSYTGERESLQQAE